MKQDAQKYEAMFDFVFVLFFLYISSNAKLKKRF